MGAIYFRRIELVATLSEQVGFKAGLALSRERIADLLEPEQSGLIIGDDDATLRVRSEEYAAHLCKLLHAVGNIDSPDFMPSTFGLYSKFKNNASLFPVYLAVQQSFNRFCEESYESSTEPIELDTFVEQAKSQHGTKGEHVAMIIADCVAADMHKSFLTDMRRIEWKDVAELETLFASEKLTTLHGEFFDQRFIDFLSHNFNAINDINWRKFEGLTCEFFHRLGFYVEIGKGRDDDSVDARIWKKRRPKKTPPLIVVQCKRERKAVGKIVVKALYADVIHEQAQAGLIVTSTALAPGARKVCLARSYPIVEANRDTLKSWLAAMRTPYSGVFLGE